MRALLLTAIITSLTVIAPNASGNSLTENAELKVGNQRNLNEIKPNNEQLSSTLGKDNLSLSAVTLEPETVFTRNPFRVKIIDEASARLTDESGNIIPFAYDANSVDNIVHLPSLLAGKYRLYDKNTTVNFSVTYESQVFLKMPSSLDELAKGAPIPKTSIYLIIIAALLLSIVIFRKKKNIILLMIFIAGGAGVAITMIPSKIVPASVSTCININDDVERNQCLFDRVLYLTSTNKGDPTIGREELIDAENIRGCHEVAHAFGKYAYILAGYEVVAQKGPQNCEGGFYHGALEAASIYLEDDMFTERARTYCGKIIESDSYELSNCAHGLGHGGMFRFAGDLDRVVAFCKTLENDYREIESCSGAAYMEHARLMAAADGNRAFMPTPATPTLKLCPFLPAELAVHCYNGVAMGTPITLTSADELLLMCNNEPGPGANRLTCVDGVMHESINHARDFETAAIRCKLLDGAAERAVCVSRVAQRIGYGRPEIGVEKICTNSGVKDLKYCRVDPESYWEHLRSDKENDQRSKVIAKDPFSP
jgi:hypothetical protein